MEDEPPVWRGDDFFLSAFYNLSSCRQFGEGVPGPIPWDRVISYADRAGLDESNVQTLVSVIREMDSEYLSWYKRKFDAKVAEGKKGKNDGQFRRRRNN